MNTPKLIAFYLPQFHRNKINNSLWGPGFTEWTNVAKSRPNFVGHYQPHIPADLGFYDLSFSAPLKEQAEMAKEYGIHGFCFYSYWFDGVKPLETPLKNFLNSDINFNFCLCWANENWTKNWDGGNQEVIFEQKYPSNFSAEYIGSIIEFLKDYRYITVDGKPFLIIYRPQKFPDPRRNLQEMRDAAKALGLKGLYIGVVDFLLGEETAQSYGADCIIEFPPHQFKLPSILKSIPDGEGLWNKNYRGYLYDYKDFIKIATQKWNDKENIKRIRGVCPSWDNTARRRNDSVILLNSTPNLYKDWLTYALLYSKKNKSEFVFINAWNEWGEGCHLEPDLKYGRKYLEATKEALQTFNYSNLQEFNIKLNVKLSAEIDKKNDDYIPLSSSAFVPISYKDFVKSRLSRYPRIYSIAQYLYNFFK